MEDIFAQSIALAALAKASSGGTTDAYTKAQTDALLDGKANLVDGKIPAAELPSYVDDVLEYSSTAVFPETGESGKIYVATDTNRTYRWGGSAYVEISESLAIGETASTAYAGNKGKVNADAIAAIKNGTNIDSFADVETALAAKLNVSDVDTSLSSTSTNPVQNKSIQAPLASLVDAGAKNLLKITATSQTINGVTFTVADGSVTATGTSGENGAILVLASYTSAESNKLILTGTPLNDAGAYIDYIGTDWSNQIIVRGGSAEKIWSTKASIIRIAIPKNVHIEGLVFKPMLCTAEDYAISTKFVPYAPSNRELYEMILALQNAQNGG